jgi:hypothetical protein
VLRDTRSGILAAACTTALTLALAACGGSGSTAATAPASSGQTGAAAPPTTTAPPQCPNPEGGRCLGRLSTGTYSTVVFQPKLTYTVPAGWFNYEDTPGNFLLVPPDGNLLGVNLGTSDFIGVYTSVAAEGYNCSAHTVATGADDSPAAVVRYLRGRHGVIAGPARPVRIGRLRGFVIDLRLAHGAGLHCPGYTPPYYPIIIGIGSTGLDHGLIPHLVLRLYLLRYAGATLAVEVDDLHGGRDLRVYGSIVRRLRFD